MTLFSEVTQAFLLDEIQKLNDASLAADKNDTALHGILGRNHTLSEEKRACLQTLKEAISPPSEANDEACKKHFLMHLKNTKATLDAKRQQTNQEAKSTEQSLRILHDFVSTLFSDLKALNLLDVAVSTEPMCDTYRAIISYLANRALGKARETAGTQGVIHYLLFQPSVTPNTAFLQALDNLVKGSVFHIQDTLAGFNASAPDFQRRKNILANKELRSLELEFNDLRSNPSYSWYNFCLPNELATYIGTAKQNISANLTEEISADELIA